MPSSLCKILQRYLMSNWNGPLYPPTEMYPHCSMAWDLVQYKDTVLLYRKYHCRDKITLKSLAWNFVYCLYSTCIFILNGPPEGMHLNTAIGRNIAVWARCRWWSLVIVLLLTCKYARSIMGFHRRTSCQAGVIWDIHQKLRSRRISFVYNLFLSCPNIFKFWTEQGSDTAVFWAKFEID